MVAFFSTDHPVTPLQSTARIVGPLSFRVVAALAFGLIVSAMAAENEVVIYENNILNILGVGTTGQLIPLIVGAAGFLVMVYRRFGPYLVYTVSSIYHIHG